MAEIESPLPHNKEAEAIILGTVMVEPALLPTLLDGITREDFFIPSNALVYQAVRDLYQTRQVIDPITIWQRAQALEVAENRQTGLDASKIAALLDGTARIRDEAYLTGLMEVVKETALRRRMIRYAEYLANQARQPDVSPDKLVSDMARRAVEYSNDSAESSDLIDSSTAMSRTLDALEERWNNRNGFLGLKTGFPDLDSALLGVRGGSVYVIASAPNVGKTTLVLNMVNGILRDAPDAVGLVVSMEMPVRELMTKFLSTQTLLASQAIDSGRDIRGRELDQAAKRNILIQGDYLASRNVFFLEGFKPVTPSMVAAKLERIRAMKRRVDFLVVDYLQLMSSDNQRGNATEYQAISEISRGLKLLAVRFNIPILVVSQLSRNHAGRNKPGFQLSDLRGSGSIEQDADVVIFLEPESWEDENQPGRKLVIAKNRVGPKHISIPLVFFGHQSRFESVENLSA